MKSNTLRQRAGFTLAELLVASTVISIVMAALYTTFNTSIRTWRRAEVDLHVYQDARIALEVIGRELQGNYTPAQHLFEGTARELQFFAIVPPLNLEDGPAPRVMWIHYRLAGKIGSPTMELVREEAILTGAIPGMPPKDQMIDIEKIPKAPMHSFVLARDVLDFQVRYHWAPVIRQGRFDRDNPPPNWFDIVRMTYHRQKWGVPQAVEVVLTLADPASESGRTSFTELTAFNGPTRRVDILKEARLVEEAS